MANSTTYDWPVMNTQAVCLSQDIVGSGDLILNGSLASAATPNQISFLRSGYIRNVSITSTNDLSAATFSISGVQNGSIVQETITGPNNGTVFLTKFYDVIGSVSVDQSVTAVEVGTGDIGFLPLIKPIGTSTSLSRVSPNYALSTILSVGAGITYTLYSSLSVVDDNGVSYEDQLSLFFPVISNSTTKELYQSSLLTNNLLLKITASTTPLTDELVLILLTQ
jgi:hypothetical protein